MNSTLVSLQKNNVKIVLLPLCKGSESSLSSSTAASTGISLSISTDCCTWSLAPFRGLLSLIAASQTSDIHSKGETTTEQRGANSGRAERATAADRSKNDTACKIAFLCASVLEELPDAAVRHNTCGGVDLCWLGWQS